MTRSWSVVTVSELAGQRWPDEETCAVEGTCVGGLMTKWGVHLANRRGEAAVQRILDRIPAEFQVPPEPERDHRFPVASQLLLTEAIADEFHSGDVSAMGPLIMEDVLGDIGRAGRLAVRAYGARRILGRASEFHPQLYDVGQLHADVSRRSAGLTYEGTPLYEHPTWRLLMRIALQVVVRLGSGKLPETEMLAGPQGFRVRVRW